MYVQLEILQELQCCVETQSSLFTIPPNFL